MVIPHMFVVIVLLISKVADVIAIILCGRWWNHIILQDMLADVISMVVDITTTQGVCVLVGRC